MRDEEKLYELSRRNIFLIGFMATGKSSVGRLLAQRMAFEFVDLDDRIVKESGLEIPDIFSRFNEEYFRKLESEALFAVSKERGQVVATGGGAVIKTCNRNIMLNCGAVICLEADSFTIVERALRQGGRPLLDCPDPRGRIDDLLEERAPFYACADLTVDTTGREVYEIAEEIVDWLLNLEGGRSKRG